MAVVDIIVDGQWGSTGKGKLAGYLALRQKYDLIIGHNGPNSGHTWVDDDGTKVVLKQLPSSMINRDALLVIGAGAVINPERLLEEIEQYDPDYNIKERLIVHPSAAVVNEACREQERENLTRISSTCQGTGAAVALKAMREPNAVADSCALLKGLVGGAESVIRAQLQRAGSRILIEGSQGFDLSINHGAYPFTTSRDCTPQAYLSWSGVPHWNVERIWGCLRTYPIRVGNVHSPNGVVIGHSGPYYGDQVETSWEELGQPEERTTVTNKVRRVFTFSFEQLARFVMLCGPTHLFVNFANYWDSRVEGVRTADELEPVMEEVSQIEEQARHYRAFHAPHPIVALVGTGPKDSDMVELLPLV